MYEKEVKANGVTEHRHYLQAAGLTVALAVVRSGTGVSATHANLQMRPTQLTYYQQDHLGSIAVVTDANGAVLERMAYDPWGKRRFTNGLTDKNDSIVGVNTDRGYTEHEHLDEVGVIHMNGRLYDPLIGRFMSADPYIQSPENLQSYNRFAYVMNNPLAYTDPSGYWSWKKFWRTAITIAVAVYLGPAASNYLLATWGAATASVGASALMTVAAGAISRAVTGYVGGYLSVIATGGTAAEARAAAKGGAISGMLFGAAGGVGSADSVARYVAHGTAGCLSAVSGGGKCGEGATAAVFGKWTTNAVGAPGVNDSPAELVAKGVAATVAGGVGSVIAGGKFASGAEAAAYGYLFNAMQDFFRVALSSDQRNSNGDIGHKVVDATKSGLIASGEIGADAVAVCGVFNGACRAADGALSWLKAGIGLLTNSDGRGVVGQIAGDGANNLMRSALTTANAQVIPGTGIQKSFLEGFSYVSGKLIEAQVVNMLPPPDKR